MPDYKNVIKTNEVQCSIQNADVVICYGDIKGSIIGCDYVVLIDGKEKGSLVNCKNVSGFLGGEHGSKDRR